ncbi:alginate O-acetyltransferase AlgF [Oceaniglobus ichthyenteri]|uniref:alginate O-acetyltransferase AlgF n=1 Tax=Oceaniglobus ichthyenteri TaxID=2136177 RepID=UPI000D371CF2|nr:alginate O-acetyltransferase AlgF [Oceaniglobus ichthyenteri]
MFDRRRFLALGLATLIPTTTSAAGDAGLYQDVFDPQSSFIRVLAPGQGFATVAGTRLSDFEAGLSPYVNVMPGSVAITHAGGTTDLTVAPSSHYTIVLQTGADPVVLVDDLAMNPAKADVSLYNLSMRDGVDLFVPAARAVALQGVPLSGAKSVALKAPLTLDFELRVGDETLATVGAVALQRRAGVSVVLTGADSQFTAVAVPNTYQR